MSSNLGKVSFSFSKITKKPTLQVQPKETVKKVDKIEYIGSIENNSVTLVNAEEVEEKKPLVIPLQHPNLLIQSIINTVKSRNTVDNDLSNEEKVNENVDNGNENRTNSTESDRKETLEEMAARELLSDATKQVSKKPESNLTVPLANQNYDMKESSLEDYENIPVGDFGLAMLRGMGWDPKKGIGKNGKIVKVEGPALRPKGLGLGADKAISSQKPVGKNVSEKAVLGKGSKVRVTVGPYKNLYGTIEGFDDDAGRISVFMAISNERISMNECFVQLVTPDEFSKYSKVLNINAYNNYKEKCDEGNKKLDQKSESCEYDLNTNKQQSSSSYGKSRNYSSDKEHDSKEYSHSSLRDKKNKKYDSDSDSYDHKKSSKSSSFKDKSSSKYNFDKSHRSKSKKESKHSKKYDSDSEPSEDNRKYAKSSLRSKERSKHSSSSDESERRRKHLKKKNKKHRSRSRSRR